MENNERNEKIELYGNGFDMLIEILKDIPREMWKFKPGAKRMEHPRSHHPSGGFGNERGTARPQVDRRAGRHT